MSFVAQSPPVTPPTSLAARLDRLPITGAHRRVVLIAGIGTFFDLFDIFLAGVLATVLTQEFHLSRLALPAVIGSGFLGMAIGATGLGAFADRVGRRRAFLFTLACYSAFTFAGAFATSATMLIVTRFLAGIGIGAEPPLVDAYLGEMLPARERGRQTARAYTFGFLGVPAVGFLARVLVPLHPLGMAGWRWLFVAGALGGAVVWYLRSHLTESPRWLASVGRDAEAEAIVRELEASSHHPDHADSQDLTDHEDPAAGQALSRKSSDRLTPGSAGSLRRRMIVLCVFQIFQTAGYYGFGTLVPIVLASKGFSVVNSLTYTSVVFLGYPLGAALSVPIVERIDRRWLIVVSAALMAVFGLSLGAAATAATIVASGFAYTVVSNVFSNAFHVFQAEIFPTSVRATLAGTAYALSRISSGAMPFVLLPVLQHRGAGAMFAVVAAAMLVVMIDIGVFAPSTTGHSLERIEAA